MTKRWLGQAVVRLYPTEIRETRGDELVGTLLDAGDASPTAFITELVSLVLGALKAQSRQALAMPISTLIFQLLCWGAIVSIARTFVGVVAQELRWGWSLGGPMNSLTYYVLPALVLLAFSMRRFRFVGSLGLLWVVAVLHARSSGLDGLVLYPRWSIEELLLPLTGSLLMLVAPRRAPTSAPWLWLLPAAIWAAHEITALGSQSGVGMVAPVALSMALLPLEPAFALGTALAWTLLLSWYLSVGDATWTIELAVCAPLALLLVALCRRLSARPHRP